MLDTFSEFLETLKNTDFVVFKEFFIAKEELPQSVIDRYKFVDRVSKQQALTIVYLLENSRRYKSFIDTRR